MNRIEEYINLFGFRTLFSFFKFPFMFYSILVNTYPLDFLLNKIYILIIVIFS